MASSDSDKPRRRQGIAGLRGAGRRAGIPSRRRGARGTDVGKGLPTCGASDAGRKSAAPSAAGEFVFRRDGTSLAAILVLCAALPALAEPIGSELEGAGGGELSWLQPGPAPRRSTGKGPWPDDYARMRADGNALEPIYVQGADAELVAAVREHDQHQAERLLKAGADVNASDVWGTRALALAARGGDVDLTRLLLEFGAMVDARGEGFTPLGAAALHGQSETVRLLLQAGADPNLKSSNGRTPLMEAVVANRPDIAQVLMEHGAEIDQFSREGNSALSLAAMNGFHEVLARMLELGADPNLWDKDRRQPLWWAVSFEHRLAVQVLLRHGADAGAMSVERFLD